MFSYHPPRDAGWLSFIKRTLLFIAAVHLLIGLVSTYRAYFQIHRLDIVANDTVENGSVIQTKIVTYGRALANVQLELVQNGRTLRLGEQRVPGNELGFYDPRTQKAAFSVSITSQMLDRFVDGPATLRATAVGTPQWMRLPPPFVQEMKVEISKSP